MISASVRFVFNGCNFSQPDPAPILDRGIGGDFLSAPIRAQAGRYDGRPQDEAAGRSPCSWG